MSETPWHRQFVQIIFTTSLGQTSTHSSVADIFWGLYEKLDTKPRKEKNEVNFLFTCNTVILLAFFYSLSIFFL